VLEPERARSSVQPDGKDAEIQARPAKVNVAVSMAKGVGISLVTNACEELLYLTMNGIQVELALLSEEQNISLRIQKLQVRVESDTNAVLSMSAS